MKPRPPAVPGLRPRQLPRWRVFVYGLLAVLLGLGLLFGVGEVALRWAGYGVEPALFRPAPDGFSYSQAEYGRLYFPQRLVREGYPTRFRTHKAPGTFRVFVLGESAAMGFPSPRFGLPRLLEVMLRESFPEVRFEVVNAALAGINSYAVLALAREVAAYEPDVVVLYAGNNEVVGPFGPGTAFGTGTPPYWLARLVLWLRTWRLGQWIDAQVDRLTGVGNTTWGGMAMFVEHPVSSSHPALPGVYDSFRRNLRAIFHSLQAQDVPVVAATLAVNLDDCPPFLSAPAGDATKQERRQQAATAAQAAKDAAGIAAVWREAVAADPDWAEAWYQLGRALRGQGDTAAARQALSTARDLDTLRFRADSRINAVIREEARAAGVPLVDAEELVVAQPGRTSADFFWEHVHLNFEGNHLLASALLPEIAGLVRARFPRTPERPVPGIEEVIRLSGYTPLERGESAASIVTMFGQAPFTLQSGQETRLDKMKAQVTLAASDLLATDLEALQADLAAESRRHPDDPGLLIARAQVLGRQQRWGEAAELIRRVVELQPNDLAAWTNLGDRLLRAGRTDEAAAPLRRALALDPSHFTAVSALARVHMLQNDPASARGVLEEFLRREPGHVEARVLLAQIARFLGEREAAARWIGEARKLAPEDAQVQREAQAVEAMSGP